MLEEELRSAAVKGNLEEVNVLLRQGAKLSPDASGRNALHLAAASGHLDVVDVLVNSKNVNSVDAVGRTPLQIAAAGGHVEIVEFLIKQGASVNTRDTVHGNTALHEASWHGFSKTVALLAKYNTELNTTNCAGFAALHLCCQNGHNQSCRELLLANANPDIQNNYGDTALHTSARYGHAGVARILISASCNVSEQNKNGDTALHIAAAMGRRKLTTIFLEAGCDQAIRNKQNETALDIATRKDLNEIIIILKSVKPHKHGKKKQKSSETSDSDKKDAKLSQTDSSRSTTPWSPYGCHYYPDVSTFPSPKLDTLPGEPLSKGEQYYLDLAGNIRKGPVGVGLTCHCTSFLRDMEARLERQSTELKQRLRSTRHRLEERVGRAEGLLEELVGVSKHKKHRSKSLDILSDPVSKRDKKKDEPFNGHGESETEEDLIDGLVKVQVHETNEESYQPIPQSDDLKKLPFRTRTAVYSPTPYDEENVDINMEDLSAITALPAESNETTNSKPVPLETHLNSDSVQEPEML